MKKITLAILTMAAFFSMTMNAEPCIESNHDHGDWCCIEVGDGSAESCTNGDIWMCVGNCAE